MGYALETSTRQSLRTSPITNTTMRDLSCPPLFPLRLGARTAQPQRDTQVSAHSSACSISNLVCHNAPGNQASIISGIPNHAIEGHQAQRHLCRARRLGNCRAGKDQCA